MRTVQLMSEANEDPAASGETAAGCAAVAGDHVYLACRNSDSSTNESGFVENRGTVY